jgi:transcription elongation factor Elf1
MLPKKDLDKLFKKASDELARPTKHKKNETLSSYTCPYCMKLYVPNTHDIHILEKDRKLDIECNCCNRRFIIFL